jgi:hypothetical protein
LRLVVSSLAVERPNSSNHDVQLVSVLLLQQGPPELQKHCGFEEGVSGLLGEGVLNGKLVSNEPKGLTLRCKINPESLSHNRSKLL